MHYDAAVAAFRKAIRLNPNDAESLSALGWHMHQMGENPEITTAFCEHSVEIDPDNGLYRHRLGRLYADGRRMEDALLQFQKATTLGHDSTEAVQDLESKLSN